MCLLFLMTVHAHNGKVSYAYSCIPKKIDAKIGDWKAEDWIPINESFGKPLDSGQDLKARFKIAYNLQESALYFLIEIMDD